MNKKLFYLILCGLSISLPSLPGIPSYLFDPYNSRSDALERARALSKAREEKSLIEDKVAQLYASLEKAKQINDSTLATRINTEIENQKAQITSIDEEIASYKPASLATLFMRFGLGDDPKNIFREFNIHETGPLKLAGIYTGAVGAKVLGKRFEAAIDQSIGEPFGGFLYGGMSKAGKAIRFIFDKVTGKEGEPFEAKEVIAWQQRLDLTLQALETQARNAIRLGGRDKISRMSEDDFGDENQGPIDPQWEIQKVLFEKTFKNIVAQIDMKIKYYSPKKDSQIIEYATQIKEWILAFLEHCWNKTKTNKDLGSGSNLAFLNNLRGQLNNAFSMLNSYITYSDDSKNKAKPVATSPYAGFGRQRGGFLTDGEDDDTFNI